VSAIAFAVARALMLIAWQMAILWVLDSKRAINVCTSGDQCSTRDPPVPYGYTPDAPGALLAIPPPNPAPRRAW